MARFHYRFHANLHAHVRLPKFVLELTCVDCARGTERLAKATARTSMRCMSSPRQASQLLRQRGRRETCRSGGHAGTDQARQLASATARRHQAYPRPPATDDQHADPSPDQFPPTGQRRAVHSPALPVDPMDAAAIEPGGSPESFDLRSGILRGEGIGPSASSKTSCWSAADSAKSS